MAGTEAFTAYFFSVLNEAFSENDPSSVEKLVKANCKTCAAFVKAITDQKNASEIYVGKYAGVKTISNSTISSTAAKMYVTIQNETSTIKNSRGETIKTIAPTSGVLTVSLTWSNGWLVDRVQKAAT